MILILLFIGHVCSLSAPEINPGKWLNPIEQMGQLRDEGDRFVINNVRVFIKKTRKQEDVTEFYEEYKNYLQKIQKNNDLLAHELINVKRDLEKVLLAFDNNMNLDDQVSELDASVAVSLNMASYCLYSTDYGWLWINKRILHLLETEEGKILTRIQKDLLESMNFIDLTGRAIYREVNHLKEQLNKSYEKDHKRTLIEATIDTLSSQITQQDFKIKIHNALHSLDSLVPESESISGKIKYYLGMNTCETCNEQLHVKNE